MAKRRDKLKLGAFLYPTGHHVAAWRHPDAQADAGVNFKHYAALARTAEAAKFDLIFMADSVAVRGKDPEILSRGATRYVAQFEPLTLLSGLAALTRNIGFVATASTTYNEPYHLARAFGSLDQISGGRGGWNLVTSSNETEALNFGLDSHPEHANRYARAREFAAVVLGLWDSWEDDAFLRDKASGVYFDEAKLHTLDHKGANFQVRGPLNVARSPQGRPLVVQAGSSEAGKELAAETAEVIFTAQQTLDDARAFYSDVKGRLARYGRSPDDLKIMPGVSVYVAESEQEAQDKYASLQNLIHPEVGLSLLSHMSGGFDLSAYPLDGPLPYDEIPETEGPKSRQALMIALAKRENLSIRDLYLRIAGARGHWTLIGTPGQVADQLEERFLNHGADGFNVMPPSLPAGLDDFVSLVIPELRRRGLYREDYEGRTLRENLGLRRPEHPARLTREAAE